MLFEWVEEGVIPCKEKVPQTGPVWIIQDDTFLKSIQQAQKPRKKISAVDIAFAFTGGLFSRARVNSVCWSILSVTGVALSILDEGDQQF